MALPPARYHLISESISVNRKRMWIIRESTRILL